MAKVTFYAVIVAYGNSNDSTPFLAVCCASRITDKKFRVISLEGSFLDEEPDFKPEIGQLVFGQAEILQVWDGSILVKFYGKELKQISGDRSNILDSHIFKYVYFPRAKREIRLAGRDFYKFRIDINKFPNQFRWQKIDTTFTELALSFLTENGSSMAALEGDAFFFSWVTDEKIEKSIFSSLYERWILQTSRNGRNRKKAKAAVFLLLIQNEEAHTPIFFLANCEGIKLERGKLYYFKNLPILCNNDTLPVWALYEAESTLFCGKGSFDIAESLDNESLINLYDELINVIYMPDWLWQQYFGERLDKKNLLNWIDEIKQEIELRRIPIANKTHGWWYHWSHYANISASPDKDEKIAILAVDFPDGGPARIILIPEATYKENCYKFHENSTAVSISDNPKIIEGSYRPDDSTWECIRKWIIQNREALLE